MGAQILELPVTLFSIDCGECGGTYAINRRYRDQKFEKKGFWHCPYCQTTWGYGEGENDRLKKELEAERRRKVEALERANEAEQEKLKAERKSKRLEKRIRAGVCPCCTRTFTNLARHMASQHPDEAPVARVGAVPLP